MDDNNEKNNDKVDDALQDLYEKLRLLEEENKRLKLQLTSSTTARPTNVIEERLNTRNDIAIPKETVIQGHNEMKPSSSKKSEPLIYEKRKGVIDNGKEYEIIMCALYAVRFGTNDQVLDFRMTTNNNSCGDFDDIEIEVTFRTLKRCTFLFQLKHKESKDRITEDMLTKEFLQRNKKQERSKFYLPNYLKSISSFKMRNRDIIFILYTNSKTDIAHGSELSFKSYTLAVEECQDMEHRGLLMNSQPNSVFRFKPRANSEEVDEACKRFLFFTNQENVKRAKTTAREELRSLVGSDIFDSFEHFMRKWWSQNFVLTKHGLLTKLTELALSPYTKTISSDQHSEKTQQLAEAMMRFELTIVASSQEEIIKSIWSPPEKAASDLEKLEVLWHPLIVKIEDSNREVVKCVMRLLRKSPGSNRIVLLGAVSKQDFEDWTTFETLSDFIDQCGDEELYHRVMSNFKLSFQGRGSISLEELLGIDKEFAQIIQTKDLAAMAHEDLCLDNLKEKMPGILIPRIILATATSTNEILASEVRKSSTIIINCDTSFKDILASSERRVVEITEYLSERNVQRYEDWILSCSNGRCTGSQFQEVCERSKKSNVYVFQVLNEEKSVLLLRKGNQLLFETSFVKEYIEEANVLRTFDGPLKVFCSPPGMGKSTLMKLLKNLCPSNTWTVFVNLINHNSFLASNPSRESIWSRFLDTEEDCLTKQTKLLLWKNRKMQIFLDGLDEVDSKYLGLVIDFIKYASAEGASVWVSSRDNLRERISQDLNIVPIEIKVFDENQQKRYIHEKLKTKFTPEEITTIVTAVFNSADINNSQELLGIPLQLHILTETFLNNEEAYEDLQQQNIFQLTQMYRLFFEGKKKSALKKIGVDEHREAQLGFNFEHQLEQYEIPALKSCLDKTDFEELNLDVKTTKRFMEQIRTNGDKHAIIKSISADEDAAFDHQTYAEYFACLWFRKNKDKVALMRERMFLERYENLRLIFDIMMAERNPLHLSVIYKNLEQFEKHLDKAGDEDEGGRTALHLACSYGMKYPPVSRKLDRETAFYVAILEILMHEGVRIDCADKIFKYDYLMYSVQSTCLYPLEKMLEKGLVSFDALKGIMVKYYEDETLAFYCAQLGYPKLLSELIRDNPEFVNREICDEYLLQTAVIGSRSDNHKVRRDGNVAAAQILVDHGADTNQILKQSYFKRETMTILDFVCQNRWYDMFKVLLENGARCIDGNSILHRICQYHTIDYETIEFLEDFDIDVNVRNDNGVTAVHLVCESGDVESLKNLLRKDVDLNVCDDDGNNAMHFACQALKGNAQIVDVLTDHGVEVNARNEIGTTALQLACLNQHAEIVRTLLGKGASGDVVDNVGKNALFYACQSRKENTEVVTLLMDHGTDVNVQTKDGLTCLHVACRNGHAEIVARLLDNGANPNILDNDRKNALYFACLAPKENTEIVDLLLNRDINVNGQNKSGTTPLHVACKSSYLGIAEKLLKKEVNLNIVDGSEQNALHYAYQSLKANAQIVCLLIDHGIDVNMRNKSGMTALHLACLNGQVGVVERLMARSASGNAVDNDAKNALHFACQSNEEHSEIVDLLVSSGTDPNAQDGRGTTPLHLACHNGHARTVTKLLRIGASRDLVDNEGRNALHFACQSWSQNVQVVDSLLDDAVDVNARSLSGATALHLCCEMGHVDVVKRLIKRGADLDAVNVDDMNALHFASQSRKDNSKVIDLLVGLGLDVDSRNRVGATALHLVCRTGQIANARKLLERGARADAVDADGKSVLDFAHQFWGENAEISNLLRR